MATAMRKVLDYSLLPILLAAGFLVVWVLDKHGWKGFVVGTSAAWGYVVLLRVIEKARPFEPAWNRSDGQLANDIAIPFIASFIFLMVPFATWLASVLSWATQRFPLLGSFHVWPTHWPAIVSIPLGVIVYDLGYYLFHRWSHTISLFWRFHSVHHSVPRLSAVNAMRSHPFDGLLETVIGLPIVTLLGAPAEAAMWFLALSTYGGILTHANIDMRSGILSYVINTPDLHRWHHSRHQRETDTNFGRTMIWDHVFGTYYHPKRRPPRDVGVDFPVSAKLIDLLIQPFTSAGHRAGKSAIPALPAGEAGVR